MSFYGPGFSIQLQYQFARDAAPRRPLTHPLVAVLRAVRDGGSIQSASRSLKLSYRHVWGLLRAAEVDLGCGLVTWVRGEGSTLTPQGLALVHAEDLALSRLAPQIEALRSELARAFDAALGPHSLPLTLFASHDLALPLLREAAQAKRLHLDLRFLGSVDSLRALAAGRCKVAGFHAPVAAPSGSGYAQQLKPLLQPGTHKLIGFARRMQGLIVAAGNPLGLASMSDLTRPGLRYIARQPGSGTRLLGDALFEQAGIVASSVASLAHVEESHLAVAATVACGAADAGLGIAAAAQAFGLGFVPLAEERYFFVCLKPSLDDPAVQSLQDLLGSAAWATHLTDLNGYQSDAAGEVLRLTEALPWWDEVVGTPRRKPAGREPVITAIPI